jgi:hypothetical protein
VTHPPYEPYPVSSYPSYPSPSDRDRQLPPPSKTQAGWALGLAIIPSVITWIISVVFACSVISRSRDGRDHGKGMAVAALVIVGVWVAIAITVIAVLVATNAERDERGGVTDGGRATIVGLHVGDCLPAPEATDEEQLAVQVVPCGEPHDAEVYANFDLDGEWTTLDEVDQISGAGCVERFPDYVGIPPGESSLNVLYFIPINERSFNRDSAVVCILVAPEPLVASLEGSKR